MNKTLIIRRISTLFMLSPATFSYTGDAEVYRGIREARYHEWNAKPPKQKRLDRDDIP